MRRLLVAIAAVSLAGCTGSGAGTPATSPRLVEPPAEPETLDLGSIVLQPNEAPVGAIYDPGASGPLGLPELGALVRSSTDAEGFEAAYRSAFPDERANLVTPPARNEVRGAISIAILFDEDDSASAFLRTRLTGDQRIPGGEYSEPDLGDESRAVVTELTRIRPRIATITWRRGNIYLFLNVYGDYAMREALAMANLIDARAVSAVQEAGA